MDAFNLAADASESKDVIGQHPEIGAELQRAFANWFHIGADPITWKAE